MPNTLRPSEENADPLLRLYQMAEEAEIPVYAFSMETALESFAIQLPGNTVAIAIDPGKLKSAADEKRKLAHELGHSFTGAFYTENTPLDERGRCELRANRWSYRQLMPYSEVLRALRACYTTPAELAEYFDLPQDFVEAALAYYTGPCGLRLAGSE